MKMFMKLITATFALLAFFVPFSLKSQEFLSTLNDGFRGCINGISIEGEFLYVKPFQNDLDFISQPVVIGQTIRTDFYKYEWKPGYRICLAKDNCCGDWALSSCYENFNSSDKRSFTFAPTETFFSNFFFGDPPIFATTATITGNIHVQFQTVDLLLSQNYCFSDCSTLTPFFGLEGFFLKQKQHLNTFETIRTTATKWNNDAEGIGFKGGLKCHYALPCNFSFYTKACASIIGTQTSFNYNFIDIVGGERVASFFSRGRNEWIFIPGYQLDMGLMWDTCLFGSTISFKLGYEFADWFNVPSYPRYNVGATVKYQTLATSNFGYHGVHVGLNIAF